MAADRIVPLVELLLGAAYADAHFHDHEADAVLEIVADLTGGAVPPEVAALVNQFDPKAFDLEATAAVFAADDEHDRKRVLHLVASIQEADEEHDLREDDYLRALAEALALPVEALGGLTVDVEVEELQQELAQVRRVAPPPPPPRKAGKGDDVDVDLD